MREEMRHAYREVRRENEAGGWQAGEAEKGTQECVPRQPPAPRLSDQVVVGVGSGIGLLPSALPGRRGTAAR